MDFDDKSEENLALAEDCLRRKKYFTAVIGRTYYAVFHKVKHYLTKTGFDYDKFLVDNGYKQRAFSHGTLRHAISWYLSNRGYKYQDLLLLNKIDDLYTIRRKADYKKEKMDFWDLKNSLSDASEVIEFINKIEG